MLDKTEFDFIEKIISLTTNDKLIWFRNGKDKLTSEKIDFSIKELNTKYKEIQRKNCKAVFDLYKTAGCFQLDCIFYREDDNNNDLFNIHSEFSLVGENDVTMEYRVLSRLYSVILAKIETKEEKDKKYDILNFIEYNFF